VAEQLAFEQILRQRPASNLNERLAAALATAVDRAGDHAFAGAALAGDHDGGLGVGDAIDHVENLPHLRIVADDVVHAAALVELAAELGVLFDDQALGEGPLDRHHQLVVDQRFGEVVDRAGPQRFNRRVGVAVAGDQDHLALGVRAADLLQEIEAVAVLEADVDQEQVVGFAGEAVVGFR
jgi:hypothetical protein